MVLCFASHPADCILMRFTAEGEGTVDFLARLRRVGNACLSMTWEEGRLVTAGITADSDYHWTIVYEGQRRDIALKAGESLMLYSKGLT